MPIFRHRIKITEAADRYRAFCARYGTIVTTKLGTTLLPPRPETAATLDDDPEVAGRRMPVIRAAAHEYLHTHLYQADLRPATLYEILRKVPGVGAWSAARIVADTTGNFRFHTQAGFGTRKHWQQHTEALGSADHEAALQDLWKSCTYRQHSTAIALTTHQRLNDTDKAEAADTAALHRLLQDVARPTGSRPQ